MQRYISSSLEAGATGKVIDMLAKNFSRSRAFHSTIFFTATSHHYHLILAHGRKTVSWSNEIKYRNE